LVFEERPHISDFMVQSQCLDLNRIVTAVTIITIIILDH
jgi:hypothetical protein